MRITIEMNFEGEQAEKFLNFVKRLNKVGEMPEVETNPQTDGKCV